MLKNEIATTVHHDGYEQYWHYWKGFQLVQSNHLAEGRGSFKRGKMTSSIFNFKRPLGSFLEEYGNMMQKAGQQT